MLDTPFPIRSNDVKWIAYCEFDTCYTCQWKCQTFDNSIKIEPFWRLLLILLLTCWFERMSVIWIVRWCDNFFLPFIHFYLISTAMLHISENITKVLCLAISALIRTNINTSMPALEGCEWNRTYYCCFTSFCFVRVFGITGCF